MYFLVESQVGNLLKKDSMAGVFLRILRDFSKQLFG